MATEESSDVGEEQKLHRVLTTQPNLKKKKSLISPLKKHRTKKFHLHKWNSGNKICSCLTRTLNRDSILLLVECNLFMNSTEYQPLHCTNNDLTLWLLTLAKFCSVDQKYYADQSYRKRHASPHDISAFSLSIHILGLQLQISLLLGLYHWFISDLMKQYLLHSYAT